MLTEADRDRIERCSGARSCASPHHFHGCYADLDGSACDEPEAHPEPARFRTRGRTMRGPFGKLQIRMTATSVPCPRCGFDTEKYPDFCMVPPVGWWCSRERGHEGPCAARSKVGFGPEPAMWEQIAEDEGNDE